MEVEPSGPISRSWSTPPTPPPMSSSQCDFGVSLISTAGPFGLDGSRDRHVIPGIRGTASATRVVERRSAAIPEEMKHKGERVLRRRIIALLTRLSS